MANERRPAQQGPKKTASTGAKARAVRAESSAAGGGGGGAGMGWTEHKCGHKWTDERGNCTECRNNQQTLGSAESSGPLRAQSGSSTGQPVEQGKVPAGAQQAGSVSNGEASPSTFKTGPVYTLVSRHYDRSVQRAAVLGIAQSSRHDWTAGYATGSYEQERKAASSTYRRTGAALSIGIALGYLGATIAQRFYGG